MIGNDVVDLSLAQLESNWKRKGYLDKIFSFEEQQLILRAENPTVMVWTLWSRKEAVYKIIRQESGLRGFYPLKIVNTDFENGIVSYAKLNYYTKTIQSLEMLHSIALKSPLFDRVHELNPWVEIHKNDEIPMVRIEGKFHFISKSHHGRFERSIFLKED